MTVMERNWNNSIDPPGRKTYYYSIKIMGCVVAEWITSEESWA